MEPAELSTILKPFLRRSQKSQWKESHTVATLWKPIRSGLDRFFSGSLQRKPVSIIRDKYSRIFKPANEALYPSLKLLARQGLISFTKHKRPISSKDLEVLYAANQLGLNAPESFVNSAWFNTIFYFGKRLRKERPWKPTWGEIRWPLAQNNNKPVEVLHLKRESDEKSVHLQVLQILHILCFTDVNSETETHFFLVKFLNSTSEYMNQKRQVFEFLIQGALRELISHDSLSNLVQSQWK